MTLTYKLDRMKVNQNIKGHFVRKLSSEHRETDR